MRVADDRDADWVRVTEATLRSLAHLRFATAIVGDEGVAVRGIATDAGAWRTATAKILDALPAGMSFDDKIRIVEPDASEDHLCIVVLDAAVRDRPITFEMNRDDVKSGARPVLDEIVQLASACPALAITIVGHIDSGEREKPEAPLGEARALAVRDYLVAGGISPSRIALQNAGTSAPLVDGRGEFARSANRRVSFRFELP